MHVTNLEACPFAGKTSGAECAQTSFVSDFSKRIGLIHELTQLARSEERVYNAAERFGVDQVDGFELFAVANVHTFAYGAGHAGETYAELVGQLFAYCAHAPV